MSSYDRMARIPVPGSVYVWELDNNTARTLIEVVALIWNGEEWWVKTKPLSSGGLGNLPTEDVAHFNDLSRFWEAVTPVRERKDMENARRVALERYRLEQEAGA